MAGPDFSGKKGEESKDALRPSRGILAGIVLGVCLYVIAGIAWMFL